MGGSGFYSLEVLPLGLAARGHPAILMVDEFSKYGQQIQRLVDAPHRADEGMTEAGEDRQNPTHVHHLRRHPVTVDAIVGFGSALAAELAFRTKCASRLDATMCLHPAQLGAHLADNPWLRGIRQAHRPPGRNRSNGLLDRLRPRHARTLQEHGMRKQDRQQAPDPRRTWIRSRNPSSLESGPDPLLRLASCGKPGS
jgi:hypothetical protein